MDFVSAIIEPFPYIGLFLLLILGGIGLPVPEDATLVLCGFLIANDVIRPLHALAVVYAGLLAADTVVYHLGKKYGSKAITHRGFQRLLSAEKLSELEKRFNRKGIFVILFGRHLVGLRVQIFLAAGILRMQYVKFILADAASAIITIAIMVGVGYGGGSSLEIILKDVKRVEHWVIFALFSCLTVYLIYRYIRSWRNTSP